MPSDTEAKIVEELKLRFTNCKPMIRKCDPGLIPNELYWVEFWIGLIHADIGNGTPEQILAAGQTIPLPEAAAAIPRTEPTTEECQRVWDTIRTTLPTVEWSLAPAAAIPPERLATVESLIGEVFRQGRIACGVGLREFAEQIEMKPSRISEIQTTGVATFEEWMDIAANMRIAREKRQQWLQEKLAPAPPAETAEGEWGPYKTLANWLQVYQRKIEEMDRGCRAFRAITTLRARVKELEADAADSNMVFGHGWQQSLKAVAGQPHDFYPAQLAKAIGDLGVAEERVKELEERIIAADKLAKTGLELSRQAGNAVCFVSPLSDRRRMLRESQFAFNADLAAYLAAYRAAQPRTPAEAERSRVAES